MQENKAKFIILGLLNHESMTGYDIKKRIEVAIHHFWDVGYGQIYPTLRQCEQAGLVCMRQETQQKAPDRKIYTITDQGRAVLNQWLEKPVIKETFKLEILVKLFFGSQIPREVMVNHLQQFETRNENKAGMFSRFEKDLKAILDQSPDHLHYYLTVTLGKMMAETYVAWAREAIRLFQGEQEQTEKPGGGH